MNVVKVLQVRGWLPAGLVLNVRLTPPTKGSDIMHLPIRPKLAMRATGKGAPAINFAPINQADANTAIMVDQTGFKTPAVVAPLPIGGSEYAPARGSLSSPSMLALAAYYEGEVRYVTGDDIPATNLALAALLVKPGSPFEVVVSCDVLMPSGSVVNYVSTTDPAVAMLKASDYASIHRTVDDEEQLLVRVCELGNAPFLYLDKQTIRPHIGEEHITYGVPATILGIDGSVHDAIISCYIKQPVQFEVKTDMTRMELTPAFGDAVLSVEYFTYSRQGSIITPSGQGAEQTRSISAVAAHLQPIVAAGGSPAEFIKVPGSVQRIVQVAAAWATEDAGSYVTL